MTERAEADLAEIWAYLAAEASETVADRVVNAAYAAYEPLREFPMLGAQRPQFARGLRVVFSGGYAIYYISDDVSVIVVRVLHGSRDAAAIAEHGGFAGEA